MVLEAIAQVQNRQWIGRSRVLVALWLTVMFLAIKLGAGWASGSLSLMATSLITLITSFSLLLSLLVLTSPQRVDRELVGHGRLESGLALLLVGLMGFGCCLVVGQMAQQMFGGVSKTPVPITVSLFQLLVGVTALNCILGIAGYYQARVWNHSLLRLSFRQTLLDSGVMVVTLLGLMGRNLGLHWLDPLLAGGIILVALCTGWQLLTRQIPSLLQQVAIAPEALAITVRQVEGVLQCSVIQSRGVVGRLVYVEMKLVLHPECISVTSTITERIERLLRRQYGPVEVVLHVESIRS